ncbi:MAG: translocase, partial [Pseudonocardiaceae bacterium]|nr:translocase [Pseudonocardiaceae bacterium]
MFDIGAMEFLMLGILALFIFGPDKLPDVARQAARGLRTVRAMAANARRDFGK